MQIGTICQREVVKVGKTASILDAARAMRAHHVGNVVVVDELDGIEKPIGIVTDRDIVVELVAKEVDPSAVDVSDVMSLTVVTTRHDADLFETLRFMGVKGVRRLPVLDDDGGLFGIVSVKDAMAALFKELSFVAEISTRQIERERRTRE